MRVVATLHACGGHLGSTGRQQKFELKDVDTTEKSKILHNISTCKGLFIKTKRWLLQTHETVPLKVPSHQFEEICAWCGWIGF